MPLVELFLTAAFTENLALSLFLGMCTFLAVSRRLSTAFGLGIALILVLLVTVPLNHLVYRFLLRPGALAWLGLPELDLSHLYLLCAIGVIAASVQILEMVLDRWFRALHAALGIFLPLLTVNCAILGASLFLVERHYDLGESLVFALGGGVGWALALLVLAGIQERLQRIADPPEALRGLGLTFIVVGILSLGFVAIGRLGGA